jgi:tRNA modification GTPase
MNNDTICALATANGIGALGIIRVSGDEALSVVQKSFPAKKLEKQKSHTIHYGYFMDGEEAIDEVMLSIFWLRKVSPQKILWKSLFTVLHISENVFLKP